MAGLYGYSTASRAADEAFTSTLNTLDTLGQRRTNQAMQADIAGLKMPSFGADEGGDGRMGAINNALNYQQQMFEIGRKYGRPDLMSTASKNILTLQKDLTDYQRDLVTNRQADYRFSREQLENTRKDMAYDFSQKFGKEASQIAPVDPTQFGSDEVAYLGALVTNAKTMLQKAMENQQWDFVYKYTPIYKELVTQWGTARNDRFLQGSGPAGNIPTAPAVQLQGGQLPGRADGGLVPKGYKEGGLVSYGVDYYQPASPASADVQSYEQAVEFGRALQQLTAGGAPGGTVSGQAGLFDATPSGGLRPSAPPPMPGLEGLVTSGSPLITQTSQDKTPLGDWFARQMANADLRDVIDQARTKIVRENPAVTPAGQAVQSATTSIADIERGRPAAAEANEAYKWWASEANRYFRENPAALDAAVANPVEFYTNTIKSGRVKAITSQLPDAENLTYPNQNVRRLAEFGMQAQAVEGGQGVGKSSLGENLPPPPGGVETYTGPRIAAAGNEAAALGISQAQYDALNEASGGTLDAQALLDQGFVPTAPGGNADANAPSAEQQNEAAIAKMLFKPAGLKTYKAGRDQLVAKYSQPTVGLATREQLDAEGTALGQQRQAIEQQRQAAQAEYNRLLTRRKQAVDLANGAYRANNPTLYTQYLESVNTIDQELIALGEKARAADTASVEKWTMNALDHAKNRLVSNPTAVGALLTIAQSRGVDIQNMQPTYGDPNTYMVTTSAGSRPMALNDVMALVEGTFPNLLGARKDAAVKAAAEQFTAMLETDKELAKLDAKGRQDRLTEILKAQISPKLTVSGDLTTGLTVVDPTNKAVYTIRENQDANGIITYPVNTISLGQ